MKKIRSEIQTIVDTKLQVIRSDVGKIIEDILFDKAKICNKQKDFGRSWKMQADLASSREKYGQRQNTV